ncbi:MAG: PhoU domain-containing protein [Candidatus Bathyarchaeia archaeon]
MARNLEFRKIQVTGGNTYVVSLPKKWINEINIKPNQQVAIIPQPDKTLLIVPYGEQRIKEDIEITIDSTNITKTQDLITEFMGYYIMGYDIIRVKVEENSDRQALKDFIHNKLIGTEIINETPQQVTTRCLVSETSVRLDQAISRMHILTLILVEGFIEALEKNDFSKAKDLISTDDEIDRFYLYVVRQIKLLLNNRLFLEEVGLESIHDAFAYREAAKCIERSADHAVRIISILSGINMPLSKKHVEHLVEAGKIAREVQVNGMKAFNKYVSSLLSKCIEENKQLQQLEEETIQNLISLGVKPPNITLLAFVAENIKRIAEYGVDIAYIAKRKSIKIIS